MRLSATVPLLALCSLSLTACRAPGPAVHRSPACAGTRRALMRRRGHLGQSPSASPSRPARSIRAHSARPSAKASPPPSARSSRSTATGRPDLRPAVRAEPGHRRRPRARPRPATRSCVDDSVVDETEVPGRDGQARPAGRHEDARRRAQLPLGQGPSPTPGTRSAPATGTLTPTKTTFTADLDPATEEIVVEYDKATTSRRPSPPCRARRGLSGVTSPAARSG